MSHGGFKYDAVQLIEAVRDRPCIWDKSSELYKNRTERRDAWLEVFRTLDDTYDDITNKEEKRLLGERIINKWTNMRDTFVKSLKTLAGKPKRPYVLHKHMKFLLKGYQHEEGTEEDSEQKSDVTFTPRYLKTEQSESSEDESFSRKRKKESTSRQSKSSASAEPEINEIDVYSDPRIMNEDEAFFASLLPSVVNYSEDERLEFRLEVLALMKRIKDRRNDPIY